MPAAIGAAIFALGGAAGVAAGATVLLPGLTLAGLVGSVVVTGALIGIQLLAPRPDIPKPADGKIQIKSAIPPVIYGVGRSRITPALIASEMFGSTSYDVHAFNQGRIGRFVQFYLNEDAVNFIAGLDGAVFSPSYEDRYADSDGDSGVKLYWRKGRSSEDPYAEMIEALPALWTSDHRGDGVATMLQITPSRGVKTFPKALPFGLPKPTAVGEWSIAWDPRDPSQDRDAPATWIWTDNPIVLLLHFYCKWEPGFRKPLSRVYEPVAGWWLAAMDVCDEELTRADGTVEKRYACSGYFTSETPKRAVIEALARSCDGFFEEIGGGAVVVYAGAFYETNVTVTDADVIDDAITQGYDEDEAVNKLNVKVNSAEHAYNEVEADPWVDQDELDAGAIVVARDVQAEWSPSYSQSRRLAKIEFDKARAKLRGTLVLNMFGENLKGRRFFKLDLRERGLVTRNVWCERIGHVDDGLASGLHRIEFRSVRPQRYDWAPSAEGRKPPLIVETEGDDIPIPGVPNLSIIRKIKNDTAIAIISATSPPVFGWPELDLGGRYREQGDEDWLPMMTNPGLQCLTGPVLDGRYEVQTWFIGGAGSEGDKSPIGLVDAVADEEAPGPPRDIQASRAGAVVTFSARAGNAKRVRSLRFRRGLVSETFAQANEILDAACAPNQVIAGQDTPGGTFPKRYWAESYNGSDVPSGAPIFVDVA